MYQVNSSASETTFVGGAKLFLVFLWLVSLAVMAFFSYSFGKNSVPADITRVISPTPTVSVITPQPTQGANEALVDTSRICKKSGLSQKWEYLISYKIKDGDSLALIAEREMNDAARIDEIGMLNSGTAQLVVGSVIYLPPKSIKKSSGNIKEANGMLMAKNNSNWHISFGGGLEGPGLKIPGYWFVDVQNKNDVNVGECVSVLFDDGFKVFTVTLQ